MFSSFFFFQAEDGIRDRNVTGVQTCALPISILNATGPSSFTPSMPIVLRMPSFGGAWLSRWPASRSEERRVGKEGRSRGSREYVKKKEQICTARTWFCHYARCIGSG